MKRGLLQYFLGYYPLKGSTVVPMWAPPRGSVFPDSYLKLNPNFQAIAGVSLPAIQLTANPSGPNTTYVIDKVRLSLAGDVGGAAAGTRVFGLELSNGASLGNVEIAPVYVPGAPAANAGVLYDSGTIDFGPFGAGPNNILGGAGPGIRLGPDSYVYLTNSAAEQITGTFLIVLMYHIE